LGFPTGWSFTTQQATSFLAPLPGIEEEEAPTSTTFSHVNYTPASSNYPLGRIALNVCFGNRQNYRREKLDFEVMDWPSQYHAILG
jgi:hypothetical protein